MELYAMPAATQTLLDDAVVDIDRWIAEEVEAAFAEQESAAFVNGDGVNKPKGFLDVDQVEEEIWEWGRLGTVQTGGATFPADNPSDVLVDLIYALKAGYRQNASFVMNRKTQSAIRKLQGRQRPVSLVAAREPRPGRDADGLSRGRGGGHAGHRARMHCAVAFGDFKRGYLVVDRAGMRVLRDPYSAKPYVLFYTTKRVGGGVQDYAAIKLLKFAARPESPAAKARKADPRRGVERLTYQACAVRSGAAFDRADGRSRAGVRERASPMTRPATTHARRDPARCSASGVTAVRPPQALGALAAQRSARPADDAVEPVARGRGRRGSGRRNRRGRRRRPSSRPAGCGRPRSAPGWRPRWGRATRGWSGAGCGPCAVRAPFSTPKPAIVTLVADIDPARLGRIERHEFRPERPLELQDGEIDAGLRARRRAGHEGGMDGERGDVEALRPERAADRRRPGRRRDPSRNGRR